MVRPFSKADADADTKRFAFCARARGQHGSEKASYSGMDAPTGVTVKAGRVRAEDALGRRFCFSANGLLC